jgi:glycosyltransferase involved in cell wall biosynthesis
MRISGFSFVRNGIKLGYPVKESILSILPLCDEFFIAVGRGEDDTAEQIASIGDPKIKMIETVWDPEMFVHGAVNAYQTNIALKQCSGDWCFYIQADEVLHEKYLPTITAKCQDYLPVAEVEGLLCDYIHFWGSFNTYHRTRNWYRAEVRIVRNHIGIESFQDAQGFRRQGRKLQVTRADASIYHYGWVRPAETMRKKKIALDSLYHDQDWVNKNNPQSEQFFDYGTLKHLAKFKGTHPAVMTDFISRTAPLIKIDHHSKTRHEHDKLSVRLLSWLERHVLHYRIGEWKNYILLAPGKLQHIKVKER